MAWFIAYPRPSPVFKLFEKSSNTSVLFRLYFELAFSYCPEMWPTEEILTSFMLSTKTYPNVPQRKSESISGLRELYSYWERGNIQTLVIMMYMYSTACMWTGANKLRVFAGEIFRPDTLWLCFVPTCSQAVNNIYTAHHVLLAFECQSVNEYRVYKSKYVHTSQYKKIEKQWQGAGSMNFSRG